MPRPPVRRGLLVAAGLAILAPTGAVAEPTPSGVLVRGLRWNAVAGGVPSAGGLFHGEIGFSGLPRLAYHHTLRRGFSIGGAVAFDYAYARPGRRFARTAVLQVPMRWTFHRGEAWTVGARIDPGVQIGRERGLLTGLLLGASLRAGRTVAHRFVVGAAVDVPLRLAIRWDDGRPTTFDAPLLAGGVLEMHVTPPLALTAEVLAGPYVTSQDLGLGLRCMVGVAYRP